MTIHSTTRLRIFALAAAFAFSAAAFTPVTLLAASAQQHHVAKHTAQPGTEGAAPGVSKNAAEDQSNSCWMMTDPDHNYGYNVPCTTHGAMHR